MTIYPEMPGRRQFLSTALCTAGAGALASVLPGPVYALGGKAMGSSELIVISDGSLSLPLSFVLPESIDRNEVDAFLAAHDMDTEVLTPDCNITVWRQQDRLVLFDVGSGSNFMPTAGMLGDGLAEAGIDPADVTDVVFTHAHPDHLWGLIDDFDELVFTEANYHMSTAEWEYWRAGDTMSKTPDARKSFVAGAQNRMPYIEDRIMLFDAGAEILPGLEAIDTRGHTPGHTSFALHDGNDSVIVIGDAITNAQISFEKPRWPSGSDQDPEMGRATRLELLDRLASDASEVVGFHLPHPGLGQVEKSGDHYRFVAAAG